MKEDPMLSAWQEGEIQNGDMVMHYTRTGGEKPALVLAHGFSDNGLCWLPVARALCADYDVVLPDARGHGRSCRLQPGQQIHRAGDLAAFIRALGLDRPVVGGHSMGGVTAAMLGAQFPELARALILEDPAWIDLQGRPGPRWAEDNPWRRELERRQTQAVEEIMAEGRAEHPTWPEIEWRPWAESKTQLDLNVFQAQDTWEAWQEVVRRLRVPTLLITADPEKGAIVTPAAAETARALNPLLRVAHVPGAGHSIRRENFAGYMEAVRGFLKTI
jgi:pimeloyl-ACP methyl ester carboxylesterase